MRYGSVCSGIEAATVAWHPLGWEPAWFSEIEPFPSAVLAHHYPAVPNLGDMTTIAARVLAGEVEAPDVLVGGTPCQAFSVAGLRRSLDDDRGNLALAFVRLAAAVDSVRAATGKPPAWILWENVPGVLSVRDNAFGCFLGGLVGADAPLIPDRKWRGAGVAAGPARVAAWRTLDAQFFGVAQRRRRVFVLARGGAGAWGAPDALLPLTQGLRWHPAPRREAGPEAAPGAGAGAAFGGNRQGGALDVATACNAKGGAGRMDFETETFVVAGVPPVAGPLGAHASGGWDPGDHERNGALIPIPFDTTQVTSRENRSRPEPGSPCHPLAAGGHPLAAGGHPLAAGGHPPALAFSMKDHGADAGELCPTIRAGGHAASHANGGVPPAVAFHVTQDPISSAETTPAMGCGNRQGCGTLGVATPILEPGRRTGRSTNDARIGIGIGDPGDPMFTLPAERPHGVHTGMSVRRLTPRECERLQGFPDDYTLIPWGKGIRPEKLDLDWVKYLMRGGRMSREECARAVSDGPRYRALGNSMAVTVMGHIGLAIHRVNEG